MNEDNFDFKRKFRNYQVAVHTTLGKETADKVWAEFENLENNSAEPLPLHLQNLEGEVKPFLIDRGINGHTFSNYINARSFAEAESLAQAINGKVIGQLEEIQCGRCLNPIIAAIPGEVDDDFPELLNGDSESGK